MTAIDKINSNPNMKLAKADKDAVVNALKTVDYKRMADEFKGLGKAFTFADRLLKVKKVGDAVAIGIVSGDWRPLALEVEAMILSGVAGSVALGIVTAILTLLAAQLVAVPAIVFATLTVIAIISIAIAASYIDAQKADQLNNAIVSFFKK